MTRGKKAEISRQGVIDAALEEFSTHGYQGASLNRVCQEKNISKGRIYHYFKDKDELYLLCVKTCFEDLKQVLETFYETMECDIEKSLKKYVDLRMNFFAENPIYLGIFFRCCFKYAGALKRRSDSSPR